MIPARAAKILTRLLTKTQAGEIRWLRGKPSDRPMFAEYRVQLPEGVEIKIERFDVSIAIFGISVTILDSNANLVARAEAEEGEEGWEVASALYAEAEANVSGWGDDRLDLIEHLLDLEPEHR